MKKVLALVVVFAIALIGANAAFAKIANSKHDLSTLSYTGTHLSSCQYCHAPHNPVDQTAAPLWNRSATANAGLTNYTFYGTTFAAGAPGLQSITCLSCHDGVLAITATKINQRGNADTLPNDAGNIVSGKIASGNALIGPSLSNDHPVGVVFGASGTAGVSTTFSAFANGYATVNSTVYRAYGTVPGNAKVECSSCHDPHGLDYAQADVTSPFLRGSIETICSDCHNNK